MGSCTFSLRIIHELGKQGAYLRSTGTERECLGMHPLFHALLLRTLLWQLVLSQWVYTPGQAQQRPRVERTTRPLQAPTPFAGHCQRKTN